VVYYFWHSSFIRADMNHPRTYIMDDLWEGQRVLDTVDAASWISKYLEHHLQGVASTK